MPRLIQNTLEPLYEMKKIKGIDNLCKDDLRLDPGFVRIANNVDIDSEMMARRRKGIRMALLNGKAHSGWSDEDKLCFVILNNDLIQINPDWTTTTLLPGAGPSKMNFVKVGDRVFFSNRMLVGYIQNSVAHGFPAVTRTERQVMVGGELIEYYESCLWAAQDAFIFRSIAGNPFEMDVEKNSLLVGGPVTMLAGVNGPHGESGLYLSAGGKCVYLSNLMPDLYEARWKNLLDVPALPGSAVKIERMDLGSRLQPGLVGQCVIFSTIIGIFMGLPGGSVRDLTSDHYAVADIEEGSSLVKWHAGYRQYIFMGQAPAEVAGATIQIVSPSINVSLHGTNT